MDGATANHRYQAIQTEKKNKFLFFFIFLIMFGCVENRGVCMEAIHVNNSEAYL